LAPRWFPRLLALEVPTARWSARDTSGHSPPQPRDERRKPALGRTSNTRRTAQARRRCRTDYSRKVYGEEENAAIAGLDIRDRDCVYGGAFLRRLRAMGIRDRPIAPRSPWQNACAERLIGSIRRDCLDHVIVFGERNLRHLLKSYQEYYNEARTHLSVQKDAPVSCAVQAVGQTFAVPILGGLHHQYVRT
jgi:Integrase core domain